VKERVRAALRPVGRTVGRALGRAGLAALAALALIVGWLWATTDVDRARFVHPDDALTITDRHGAPLRHHRPDGFDRRWIALEDVSPNLVDAVIAVEDDRFYEHHGADARATLRALATFALPGRRTSGGSTITQQLVKLVYRRPDGILDKPREIARALMLERRFDKRWILEQYLNRLPFGDNVVGVARASELYLGKPASELTVGEAALLAGIPQAPTALDPRRNLQASLRRRRVVLARMRATSLIDEATWAEASGEEVAVQARSIRPWRAPRAADAALLAWREGRLERRGRALRTSLDLPLQENVERILRAAVETYAARGVENGAAVVVSNASGEILAYVGAARDGSDAPGGWLDLASARRQPGSTLKPFVYELYFERGGTAASVLDDLSRPMVGGAGELFSARDYDGRERGPVRARVALSASLNLAALDASRRVGAERVVSRLRALGLDHLDAASRYGAAIVLGGADVSALELAEAYATLARGGTRVPIGLASGPEVEPTRVMDAGAALVVRDVLSDARARREAFGDDLSSLYGEGAFGLKTGTSSGWRDAWTAAFTDEVTVVVWLGDPSNRPLGGLSGFEGAAPTAVRVLRAAMDRAPALHLEAPERAPIVLEHAQICAVTGELAGARCAQALDERFAPGTAPTHRCDAHQDDGAVVLPARYARWLATEHPVGFALRDGDTADGAPRVAHPSDGSRLLLDPSRGEPDVPLRATVGGATAPSARWEVDGHPLDGARWHPTEGEHLVVALLGERRSAPIRVDVRYAR
jgi:penicillin-binding protein 1C